MTDGLLVTKVLKSMKDYLYNINYVSHEGGNIAYCDPCHAIVLVSDSYSRHAGRNMSRKKQREQCIHCDDIDFVKLSYRNLDALRERYGERTPPILINGIKKGLEKIKIGRGYTIYGKDFTEIFKMWFTLNEEEKTRQILELFQKTDELSQADNEVEKAMSKVKSLEEAL
jgi:hypothetical protein